MASVLKRKGGPLEALESPKRPKSTKRTHIPAPELDPSKVGWAAAFPTVRTTNDVNGERVPDHEASNSPEAENYEDLLERARPKKAMKKRSKTKSIPKATAWKISDPIGGRTMGIDPVFTADEKFIIIAHRNALKIYSTSNSLLNRSIKLAIDEPQKPPVNIVDYILSPTDSSIIWVACSDGCIYKIGWASGEGWERPWKTSSKEIAHMTVASIDSAGRRRDVVLTSERHNVEWRISAHEFSFLGNSTTTQSRVIYKSTQMIHILKTEDEGAVIVAASVGKVLLGTLRSAEFDTIDRIKYQFRIFESTNFISSLDVRVSKRSSAPEEAAPKLDKLKVIDVVVGDVKGAVFIHNDLLRNLIKSEKSTADKQHLLNLMPRKLHWHRKAVHCVKWSLDGSYIISGGSETVLVLWQLDTGRQQYLPHLSATVQNIVVSPRGMSYALHLGDNSTMILSTSELVPTAYIAGIQAHVIGSTANPDSQVERLNDGERERPLIPHSPVVINPAYPQKLLLAVGEVQEVDPISTMTLGAPFLQTFDIASNHNVSRQAVSRTNITNKNIAPGAHQISEPVISHMQVSYDGMWLATVDEWLPPKHDIEFLGHSGIDLEDEQRRRREVYLKFWQWSKSEESWTLVTRVDAPHMMALENYGAGRILALTADPCSYAFSTLGEDGIVQIWRPRTRKRDGVIVRGSDGEPLCTWNCQQRVSLGAATTDDDSIVGVQKIPSHGSLTISDDGSLLAAAISSHHGGLVQLINPVKGMIQSSHSLMYRGDLISIAFLAQYLIILSDDLRIYDLVLNERKYGISLGNAKDLLSLEQKAEMMHLAVDRTSHTFAIALPCRKNWNLQGNKSAADWLSVAYAEIAVFEPQKASPLYTQQLSSLVTALLPAISSPGYVILDAAAEIRTISPKAAQILTSIAKPLVELRLDITDETKDETEADDDDSDEPATDLMQLTKDAKAEASIKEKKLVSPTTRAQPPDLNADRNGDCDNVPPMVTQHQLSTILDIGPSFALPPIEELFYQVASLFSSKPLTKQIVSMSS